MAIFEINNFSEIIEFFVKLLLILGSFALLYWFFWIAAVQGIKIYQNEAKEKEETQKIIKKKKSLPIRNPFEEP